jgi:hypothetical protein
VKTFIGYGYNARDKWIEEAVFPIVEAFDDEVLHGKTIPGQQLADGVKDLIRRSDTLIGFNTRRLDPVTGELGQTSHTWVLQELAIALALDVPRLEVREKDGNPQPGIGAGVQYLEYDPAARDSFLVEFISNYAELRKRASRFELHLMPDAFRDAVAPFLADANLRCSYQLMDGDTWEERPEVATRVIKIKGGLFIKTGRVPRKDFIRVRIECGQVFRWASEYQAVDTRMIYLNK